MTTWSVRFSLTRPVLKPKASYSLNGWKPQEVIPEQMFIWKMNVQSSHSSISISGYSLRRGD
jgi:hypothetical protein